MEEEFRAGLKESLRPLVELLRPVFLEIVNELLDERDKARLARDRASLGLSDMESLDEEVEVVDTDPVKQEGNDNVLAARAGLSPVPKAPNPRAGNRPAPNGGKQTRGLMESCRGVVREVMQEAIMESIDTARKRGDFVSGFLNQSESVGGVPTVVDVVGDFRTNIVTNKINEDVEQ